MALWHYGIMAFKNQDIFEENPKFVWIFGIICVFLRLIMENYNKYVMGNMEKIGTFALTVLFCIMQNVLLMSCGTNNFMSVITKNQKYTERLYDQYLEKYGNASMIMPEGDFSVIWVYDNNKILVTHISRSKIRSTQEYNCDTTLNIKEYEEHCYPYVFDGDFLKSSLYDKKTKSKNEISISLDIDSLISNGTDCSFLTNLRNHVVKYKLWH